MYIDYKKTTLAIIFSIIIIGLIAIPIGNPKFIYRAIGLELSFVILSILLWKGYTQALYVCIPISVLVIIGNTLAPPHVNLMLTFSKPLNAIVLIVGGYILQALLIFFSIKYLSETMASHHLFSDFCSFCIITFFLYRYYICFML